MYLVNEKNQLRVVSENNLDFQASLQSHEWNELMSVDETLELLDFNTNLSFYGSLKFCQVISDCKTSWSKRNVKSDGSDWDRFVELMLEKRSASNEFIQRMIKVWESWSDSKGAVSKLYASTSYLPSSKTALYEIATLNTSDINDDRKLQNIIKFVQEHDEILVNEIRSIKKSAPPLKVINPQLSSSVPSYATKLKMPSLSEDLKSLKKKWQKIQNALDFINQQDVNIFIDYQTPTERLEEIEQKTVRKEKERTFKRFQRIVSKWDVKSIDHLKKCKEKAKKGSSLSQSAIKRNQEVDDVCTLIKKHNLESDCSKFLEEKKKFVNANKL